MYKTTVYTEGVFGDTPSVFLLKNLSLWYENAELRRVKSNEASRFFLIWAKPKLKKNGSPRKSSPRRRRRRVLSD
ncbi:MAG: hypothetical protein U5L45_10675 [Saprospiraceae bacterium]|nr:hypothetical protein [Saprospiraceae bacterium]